MQNGDDGEHPCAGQSCPAVLPDGHHTLTIDGGDNVRVFQVPPEKRADIEKILGGSNNFVSWKKAGVKLAGLFIIAACVSGEISPEPHTGTTIHAHGGHENKKVVVRRPGVREKSDGADPKPDNSETGCKNRVDLCEHRTDDGVCQIRQQSCLWMAREIGDRSRDLGQKLSDLESAMKNGFQDLKRNLRRSKVESPVARPPSDNEAARVFALMKSLDAGERVRKVPLDRVFRLLVLDDLSQNAVARICRCSTSLVSMRAKEIERRMGLPVMALRTLASRVGELASVEDSRARNIYHRGLTDDTGEDDG